jgi:hypothetical protein
MIPNFIRTFVIWNPPLKNGGTGSSSLQSSSLKDHAVVGVSKQIFKLTLEEEEEEDVNNCQVPRIDCYPSISRPTEQETHSLGLMNRNQDLASREFMRGTEDRLETLGSPGKGNVTYSGGWNRGKRRLENAFSHVAGNDDAPSSLPLAANHERVAKLRKCLEDAIHVCDSSSQLTASEFDRTSSLRETSMLFETLISCGVRTIAFGKVLNWFLHHKTHR